MGVTVKKGITSSPSDVFDDTSPELGGNLDGNGFEITNLDALDINVDPVKGLTFGGVVTGLRSPSPGSVAIMAGGANQVEVTTSFMLGRLNGMFTIGQTRLASYTVPQYTWRGDTDSGLTRGGEDQVSIVCGGVEGIRFAEVGGGVLQSNNVKAGITADVGSVQGGSPLTSSVNQISVCANVGDAVTAPACITGLSHVLTILNSGANACDVFPASGDNLGAGVDTAVSLAAGANITYRSYDDTNWFAVT